MTDSEKLLENLIAQTKVGNVPWARNRYSGLFLAHADINPNVQVVLEGSYDSVGVNNVHTGYSVQVHHRELVNELRELVKEYLVKTEVDISTALVDEAIAALAGLE